MKCLIDEFDSEEIADNIFTSFKSMNNILYLVYPRREHKYSIIFYDLIDEKNIFKIKNAHEECISKLRYYYDKIKERDLMISLSSSDIKLWNIDNFELLLQINNISSLSSACMINIKDQIYIIYSQIISSTIRAFDLNGNKIKELKSSNDYYTVFIDTYHHKKSHKNYIIASLKDIYKFKGIIKIYDFVSNSEYHNYYVEGYSSFYLSAIIYESDNYLKVIASNYDGIIRIWNFKTEKLLSVINDIYNNFYGICIWKDKYLLTNSNNGLTVINIDKEKIIKKILNNNQADNIKMINHPKYGDCFLISSFIKKKIWIVYNINI